MQFQEAAFILHTCKWHHHLHFVYVNDPQDPAPIQSGILHGIWYTCQPQIYTWRQALNTPLINGSSKCWERSKVSHWGKKGRGGGELRTFQERFREKQKLLKIKIKKTLMEEVINVLDPAKKIP